MVSRSLRASIDALGDEAQRHGAARSISRAVGARDLLLFVKDVELQIFLPAPGMPQTLRSAAAWRRVLASCGPEPSRHTLSCDGETQCATAAVVGDCGFALVGDAPCEIPVELAQSLPLLAATLRAQQRLRFEAAAAAQARESAAHARELAVALENARAAAADLNRKLQQEHEQKDHFLAMLAHELRNPLAPITSALEVMRRLQERQPGAGFQRQLDMMGRQVQQLTHLVDDLLDVSRVSRGLIELRMEALALADVLRSAIESSRPLVESRGHRLTAKLADGDLFVEGDAVRLAQVFANLLNNAAKYTEPGGRIDVSLARESGQAVVAVTDNGAGIPREMLSKIFDMFAQVPGSLERAPGGLGIGLTLVRTLVQLHGGSVRAESGGPGTGSSFIVTLPLATRVPAVADVRPPGQDAASGRRVLVVDDNVDAAMSLAEVLRLIGVEVTTAHDGAQALSAAAEGPCPDLVLMDIGLPGMDGYATAREWRRRFGRSARLVALTGYGSAEDRRRTAVAGFDGHLVKPVAMEDLMELLGASPVQPG